jgi:hypothetical protein
MQHWYQHGDHLGIKSKRLIDHDPSEHLISGATINTSSTIEINSY